VPELSWRYGMWSTRRLMSRLDPSIAALSWDRATSANAIGSLDLYRANVVSRLRHPVQWRTSLPVQLLVLEHDAFVTPRALEGLEARCRNLTRIGVDSGHWLPRTDPARMAGLIREFVTRLT
jgi:pimeloyl-ACP methyl ester carboxylesterase